MKWNHDQPVPLFKRLDLDEILETENQFVDEAETLQHNRETTKNQETEMKR